MKQAIIYSLKVWLTAVLLSPLLSVILFEPFDDHNSTDIKGALFFILLSIPYGLVLSIPSWLLLWISVWLVNRLSTSSIKKKWMLSIIGLVLSLLPFYLIFGHDDNPVGEGAIEWAVAYCIVILAGIWFYPLKGRDSASSNL